MIPKIFQPVVVILIIGALTLLRLIPPLDPIQRLVGGQAEVISVPFDTVGVINQQIQAENDQLRSELNFKGAQSNYVRADVLGKTVASFREAVRISAGTRHGLKVDQPVLSQGFLIGRLGSVEDSLSTALLLGDPDVRIPVVIGRAQGIVVPQTGGLIIDQVVGEVDAGDRVLTSGIDGIYPPGLLVGTVGDQLNRDIFGRFVLNSPLNIQQLNFVTIIVD
jgi:rod shape-determining protein MreC